MQATLELNTEANGIELRFPSKPEADVLSALKEQGFRWHHTKKIWFAKQTEARLHFASSLCGESEPPSEHAVATGDKKPAAVTGTAIADLYDRIGDSEILAGGDTNIFAHRNCYLRKDNLFFRCSYSGDSIYLQELENAGKAGKTCRTWRVSCGNFWETKDTGIELQNRLGIRTVEALYRALTDGVDFSDFSVSETEVKGIEIFSPFSVAKPLSAIPEKWTKRHFAAALQSGQVYYGEITGRYTDDYAYDAAANYSEGVPVDLLCAARAAVEDWSSSDYLSAEAGEKPGTATLYYSSGSTGKRFSFDLSCDLAEAKRREAERLAGIEQYNQTLCSACITLTPEEIDRNQIYSLQTIEKNPNTGIYGVKKETLQGETLKSRLDSPFMEILSAVPMEITPDQIYSVSNFHYRLEPGTPDDPRLIDCGNWETIVTGKALLELTAEGIYLPDIRESWDYGPSYEAAHDKLEKLATGATRYLFANKADYGESLRRLEAEYNRSVFDGKERLDALIENAGSRSKASGTHSVLEGSGLGERR